MLSFLCRSYNSKIRVWGPTVACSCCVGYAKPLLSPGTGPGPGLRQLLRRAGRELWKAV